MAGAKRVVLFGHSFVSHFEEHLRLNPSKRNLGLDLNEIVFQTRGIGGLKLTDKGLYSADELLRNADLAIIDIGSNDVPDSLLECHRVAKALVSFAEYVLYGLDAKAVVICQIIKRKKLPFRAYNDNVRRTNICIQHVLRMRQTSGIVFWKHRSGFWNTHLQLFNKRGVHLNQKVGYPRYLRSMRDCVIRCIA